MALVLAAATGQAWAAACEMLRGETITFVVPAPAGGGYDQLGRLLEPYLERHSGAEVVVSNITGAGGVIAAKAIRDAAPDGRTLGRLGANWMLIRRLLGNPEAPDFAKEFHLLGQLARDGRLLVVGADSPIREVDDLWSGPPGKKLVAAVISPDGEDIVMVSAIARLLGLDLELVSAFRGSGEANLALLRGEVDIMPRGVETGLPSIRAGEMRAILQLTKPPPDIPELVDVPALAGSDGVAARRAEGLGRTVEKAIGEANAFAALIELGRIVVATRGLEPDLAACLDAVFTAATSDREFIADVAKAGRTIDLMPGLEVLAEVEAAEASAAWVLPLIQESVRQLRK